MLAVGNISMLKPNSNEIPIDKYSDSPIYLNKEFLFYVDIEKKGRLIYSVKPLTLETESEIILELNQLLKSQLLKFNLVKDKELSYDALKQLLCNKTYSTEKIDEVLINFSSCQNPEIMMPSMKNLFKCFVKEDLQKADYIVLYEELKKIGFYKTCKNILINYFHRLKNLKKLKEMSLNYIKTLCEMVVNSYTKAILKNQELYLKYKIIGNIIRYEREFKKKLLNLFLEENHQKNPELENSILYSEKNLTSKQDGKEIPVF